jgi:hypothetical protein
MAFEQIIQNFTHVIKHKPGCLTHALPNDNDSGSSTIKFSEIAISKQTENELLMLKKIEAQK